MLPALRLAEPPERMQAQDDAVPPPREGLRAEALQPEDWNRHGRPGGRLPGLAAGQVPDDHEPEERFVHEAAARSWRDPEDRIVLGHRLRTELSQGNSLFAGPVEVDETYVGAKRRNMTNARRKEQSGRGPVGKAAVVGAKDRNTNQVAAKVVTSTDKETRCKDSSRTCGEGCSGLHGRCQGVQVAAVQPRCRQARALRVRQGRYSY